MKASRLIRHLTQMVVEHGDLPVVSIDRMEDYEKVGRPELLTVRRVPWDNGTYVDSRHLRTLVDRNPVSGVITSMPRWGEPQQSQIEAEPDIKVIVL